MSTPGRGGPAVLLGGDFNAMPSDTRLNSMHQACYHSGTGAFEEAGAAGCASRSTGGGTFSGRKIDYLFLSAGR